MHDLAMMVWQLIKRQMITTNPLRTIYTQVDCTTYVYEWLFEDKYCIVLYLHLFSNIGDKKHPFTISLYDTFMQNVRVETAYRNKSTTKKEGISKSYGER